MAPCEPQNGASGKLPRRPGRARLIRFDDGILIKQSREVRSSESAAMQYVRKHAPSVPVPAVYHTDFTDPREGLIFMDEIPGENLEVVWPSLNPNQRVRVCKDIWRIIIALRKIPRPQNIPPTESLYTTVDGSPTPHHGLLGQYTDPVTKDVLKNDDTFRGFLVERMRKNYCRDEDVKRNFPHSKAAVFTHGDIKPKNIMVSADGHINSLLDWEYSGFMPDYWEAAGMLMIVREWEKEWAETMERTKPKDWNFDIARIKKAEEVLRFGV